MSEQSSASMFDYDARPVTPQVVIVGLRASSAGYQLRDFLSRNGVPYEWVEIDDTERVRTLLDGGYVAQLSDGTEVRSRSMLVASGVDWRRLEVPGLDDLLGAGAYYGAGPSEAVSCRGCRVAVIGGGNSAGQAVVRFSRYASRVTLLVRGPRLGDSMSQYLATRVSRLENVDIRTGTEVIELDADARLRAVVLSSPDDASPVRLPMDSLFVCIGGVPRTRGLATLGLAEDEAGYLRTGADVNAEAGSQDRWPLSRPPLPLETNRPGLFAAGDVRSGSIKRCSAAIGEGSMAVALVHRRLAEIGGE